MSLQESDAYLHITLEVISFGSVYHISVSFVKRLVLCPYGTGFYLESICRYLPVGKQHPIYEIKSEATNKYLLIPHFSPPSPSTTFSLPLFPSLASDSGLHRFGLVVRIIRFGYWIHCACLR